MELNRVHSVVITSVVRLSIIVKLTQEDVTCEHLLCAFFCAGLAADTNRELWPGRNLDFRQA